MAKTSKTINSNDSDDHLARELDLRKDSIKQTERHTNKVRAKKGLPPLPVVDPVIGKGTPDDEINNQILDEVGDSELIQNAGLILGLRAYSGGEGKPVNGDELVAIHRQVRRERAYYRELNGEMVKVGDLLKRFAKPSDSRKIKTRPVPGVLKSIMVRLMPGEAEILEEANITQKDVGAAMDQTVDVFKQATGCEVVSAVAHRMSVTDLHIHIQYTMVQQFKESPQMLGRRLQPWKKKASKQARESLAKEGFQEPSPAQIGAKKKKLIAAGLLTPPPQTGIEFRKIAGKRDLGDGAILGYSFRQKLNLVRGAELGGEITLAEQVARRNDERFGRFTPIAQRPDKDLEAKYLDLWLERTWRRSVTSKLPVDYQNRLIIAGVDAAKNYAIYGTSIVEETHIKRRVKEQEAKAKELESRAQEIATWKTEELHHLAEQLAAEEQRALKFQEELEAVRKEKNSTEERMREELKVTTKQIIQERDEALKKISNPPPAVIKEVTPLELEGVVEAVAELPQELRPNLTIEIGRAHV